MTLENCKNEYMVLQEKLDTLLVSHCENLVREYKTLGCLQPVSSLLAESPRNGYSLQASAAIQKLRTVSISAVHQGLFKPDGNTKYADVPLEQVQQFLVQKDDIFVVRGNGNRALAGKCGIAHTTYTDVFYPDLLIRAAIQSGKDVTGVCCAYLEQPFDAWGFDDACEVHKRDLEDKRSRYPTA